MLSKHLAVVSCLSAAVLGHGHVRDYTIEGVNYITYLPYDSPDFTEPPVGIGRFLGSGDHPVRDPLSTAIACGVDSYPAPEMANVTAGSTFMAQWNEWPHVGPIYTYMAYCPNGQDCSDFEGTSGEHWFKIEEAGIIEYETTTADHAWAAKKMFDADNTWNITVPSCIKSGPYLIRHETMAVQDSDTLGGAQFYPQCSQVWVSDGLDTLEPSLVALPGDIQPDDPGVLFDRHEALETLEYTCPGARPIACPDPPRPDIEVVNTT